MADNVQWIRLKVGMFDGNSFKKIKRATIGGVNYRDKLTAIWFELLDLAGKGNANGCLVDNNEIPFETYEDIAIMLDRDTEEIELCMQFYLKEKMVELIGKVYCLTNFMQYQNKDGLEKIREQKRLAQARWRERKAQGLIGTNVDTTVDSTSILPSNSLSISNSTSNSKEFNISNFDTFISKYSINVDNYSSMVTEMDFNLLDKAFSQSAWLQENYVSLSRICKDYERIVGGYYKDFVKPKEEKQSLTDAEFLIAKGFSKEWVMALSEEERAEKRKKWEK